MFSLSFALLCKLNLLLSLLWFITVKHFSLMLGLLAYFDEATVLLYFAQSVLVKISTNPLSAKLRRRIMMAKRDVYVKQNLNRWYIHGCAVIVLRNAHAGSYKDRTREIICQNNCVQNFMRILLCIILTMILFRCLPEHFLWQHSNSSVVISKAKT